MHRPSRLILLLPATLLLIGANFTDSAHGDSNETQSSASDPASPDLIPLGSKWPDSKLKDTPISRWGADDAKEVLADSPWVKYVRPERVRTLAPEERRDTGNWDANVGKGVGIAGTGILGPRRQAEALARAHAKPVFAGVVIRWESADPIHFAELKVGTSWGARLDADHYAIAVYNIPTPKRWNLARELRDVAYIKRDTKKNLKPSSVQIIRHDDGTATVIYLFPRSVEITKKDQNLLFAAQVGPLFVAQYFYTADMQIQGKLEL